jgi:hypothetical protein
MLNTLIELCTSRAGLTWAVLLSDLAIALAYFAIPITMAVVLRERRQDIPYPWLWTLFVTFIVACGLTHVVHLWSAFMGAEYLGAQAAIDVFTALASVGTAVAFTYILPEIKNLPSPSQQRERLQETVAERTREKDQLIREINHRVGNQLQVLSSMISIETRAAKSQETLDLLAKLRTEINVMSAKHVEMKEVDYLAAGIESASAATKIEGAGSDGYIDERLLTAHKLT